MKNYSILLSLLFFYPILSASELYISSMMGFESEYVFRGIELDDEIVQGSVDFYYDSFCAGVWIAESLSGYDYSEIDFYGSYSFEFANVFSGDLGFTYYYYPDFESDSSIEPYLGAIMNVPFSPSIYLYYDVDLKIMTLELSTSFMHELSEKTRFEFGLSIGQLTDVDSQSDFEAYFYSSGTVNYVYQFNLDSSFSMGLRASIHDLDDDSQVQPNSATIWVGSSFTYGF